MHKRMFILCLAPGLWIASLPQPEFFMIGHARHQQIFQGIIELRERGNTSVRTTNVYFKKELLRIEFRDHRDGEFTIVDFANRVVYSVMPAMKAYIVTPINPISHFETDNDPMYKATKTKNRAIIAGFLCEQWILQSTWPGNIEGDDSEKIEIWASSEPASLISIQKMQIEMGLSTFSAWNQWAAPLGVFPLQVIRYNPEGEEEFRIEVTNIQRKILAPSVFRIPEGFTEL